MSRIILEDLLKGMTFVTKALLQDVKHWQRSARLTRQADLSTCPAGLENEGDGRDPDSPGHPADAHEDLPHLIMVTAYGREEILSAASRDGFEHVLIKPVTPSTLFNTLIQAMGGKQS